MNLAVFVSGRMIGYKTCLLPLLNYLNSQYNVKLFFSVNTNTLSSKDEIDVILTDLAPYLGTYNFEEYLLPKTYVENRHKNNVFIYNYNNMSHFYNDSVNFRLINEYESSNNISFDVICKLRSDCMFNKIPVFVKDDPETLIIHNKHLYDLRYWGHVYKNTPCYVSDMFAYGNKASMSIYCSTSGWMQTQDMLLKGQYTQAGEIHLTDCIMQYVFYNVPGGEDIPTLRADEIKDKMLNNPQNIKIKEENVSYTILPNNIRQKNNVTVNHSNIVMYTKS